MVRAPTDLTAHPHTQARAFAHAHAHKRAHMCIYTHISTVELDITEQLEEYTTLDKDNHKKEKHWKAEVAALQEAHKADIAEWGLLNDADTDEVCVWGGG